MLLPHKNRVINNKSRHIKLFHQFLFKIKYFIFFILFVSLFILCLFYKETSHPLIL
jgi:hypothetical protein